MAPTLVVTAAALGGPSVEVEGDAYRHLFRAARLAIGDRVRLVDGSGVARWSRVAAVDRRRAALTVGEEAASNEPMLDLEVLVAAPRPERASWLVEKCTEVGVAAIRFVNSERSPRRYGAANLARFERLARAAVEQCGRSRQPIVSGVHPWGELSALVAARSRSYVLDPGAAVARPRGGAGDCALVVGPEGGWTDGERRQLDALGCHSLGLGERVLRVETAAVVGAALLLLG